MFSDEQEALVEEMIGAGGRYNNHQDHPSGYTVLCIHALVEHIERLEAAIDGQQQADLREDVDSRVDEAMRRVDALELCRELLPKDFDRHGKTVKDIYVAAAGREIEKASEQSEGYLRGRLEGIVERRAAAAEQLRSAGLH